MGHDIDTSEMRPLIGAEELRNLVVESINARDPELVGGASNGDLSELEATIQTLNERFPRVMTTRGDLDDRPVVVVWMPDSKERYQQVAHIEVVPEGDQDVLSELVEGVAPSLVAEEPPGRTVAEWESARQLDRGEGRWT